MINYLKKIDIGTFASLLMILFLSAGFLVLNDYISSAATIIMWFIVLLYLVKGIKKINNIYVVPAIFLILWFVLSSLMNGDNFYGVLGCVFGFVVSLAFVSTRNYVDFQSSYIEVMKILCIVSLVGFFSLTFFTFVGQSLNSFVSHTPGGNPFYNFYFFIYKPLVPRNTGMFWEPGAFQIFINIALLLETLKPKPSTRNIAIFLVTVITTFSTTGYIAVFLIFILILLNRSKELKNARKIFMWIAPVLLGLYIFNSDFLNDTSSYSTFGKINSFIEAEEWKSQGSETSGSIRYYGFTKTLEAFFESPLIGLGGKGLEQHNLAYTYGMNTCTFANWFGKYGIVYGLVMLIGFIRLSALLGHNKGVFAQFLIFIFFFIITASEALSESPLLNMLCLYGYNSKQLVKYFNISINQSHKN